MEMAAVEDAYYQNLISSADSRPVTRACWFSVRLTYLWGSCLVFVSMIATFVCTLPLYETAMIKSPRFLSLNSLARRLASETSTAVERKNQTWYTTEMQSWVERVVLGLSLCPWAKKSHGLGHLRYAACDGDNPSDVAKMIWREAQNLTKAEAAPFSNVLIVCPHVAAWADFSVFDAWVNEGVYGELGTHDDVRNVSEKAQILRDTIELVPFHPEWTRWRPLIEGIGIGKVVKSRYKTENYSMSSDMIPAEIVDLNSSTLGPYQIRVRWLDSGNEEQDIPIEWLDPCSLGGPLPDNAVYRAPRPTVHLIRRADLEALCGDEASKVAAHNEALAGSEREALQIETQINNMQKRNSKRARELGFDGFRLLALGRQARKSAAGSYAYPAPLAET
eukprot:gnl/TRDRNA2_/TRDRNA2_28330_c0_seq1.p1 gnl/TRDRNA2_/TRDRNA2_28330_c0~~gnl/TRDRNA2_/TRDRNA2_28330_c0_seq1.p1  ORF type:complete len:391 (-),score=45.55 gnl/TRDRNA2_/TRDRNA2_28330_c0_seq1:51-1223(-)